MAYADSPSISDEARIVLGCHWRPPMDVVTLVVFNTPSRITPEALKGFDELVERKFITKSVQVMAGGQEKWTYRATVEGVTAARKISQGFLSSFPNFRVTKD